MVSDIILRYVFVLLLQELPVGIQAFASQALSWYHHLVVSFIAYNSLCYISSALDHHRFLLQSWIYKNRIKNYAVMESPFSSLKFLGRAFSWCLIFLTYFRSMTDQSSVCRIAHFFLAINTSIVACMYTVSKLQSFQCIRYDSMLIVNK